MNRFDMSRNTIKRLERRLSDAREAIIEDEQYPVLSPNKKQVTLSIECYNKIVKAINIF